MRTHLSELETFCRVLNRRHFVLGIALFLIDWACAWGLLAAWDKWVSPIQESTSFILLVIVCLLYLVSLYPVIRWYRKTWRLNLKRMASRLESSFPELNDLLVTATHLESKQLTSPNPLEAHVMQSAGQRLGKLNWRKAVTNPFERLGTVYGILATGLLLLLATFQSVVLQKAMHHLRDDFGRAPTGLVLSPLPEDIPAQSDLNIGFVIHRWQKQALIEWIDSAGNNREPVVVDDDGKGVFTFYEVTESLQFRIVTPSLRSGWKNLEVYEPARIESLSTTIVPPAYTRLPERTIHGLVDMELVQGSGISMLAVSGGAASVDLLTKAGAQTFEGKAEDSFKLEFLPEASTPYRLRLRDSKQRESTTSSATITLLPDNPPTVEILSPEKDSVLAPGDIFPVELFAADDYGLSSGRIHLALSGKDLDPLKIPLEQVMQTDEAGNSLPLKETELQSLIDLAALEAEDGDLLAIHVVMEDNRMPDPNRTRTELLFIEIREPIEPIEMDGMPMEQKPIDFREIIEEQKRLLRESHRVDSATPATRKQMLQEIPAGLGAVSVEIQRIYNEVETALVSSNRMDLAALFMRALADNARATELLQNDRVNASLPPQASSLSALLKLENAFRQNIKSKQPSEGSSGEGEGGESKEQAEQGPSEGKSIADALKEAKKKLDDIIREQNALVSEFDRASRSGWSGQQAATSAKAQGQLGEETRALRRELNGIPGSENAGAALAQARRQMNEASTSAATEDAGAALRSGYRAREALRTAAAELAGLIADTASRELEAAAQAASKLAEQQAAAAGSSQAAAEGNPTESELAAMEARQRDLKERLEDLLASMQERARDAARTDPRLGEALQEAARNAGQRGTSGNMERAANALLYGQPGMAAPMQTAAASQLSQLAGDLRAAREEMENDPARRARELNRELQTTLEELQNHARNPETAPRERLDEIREEWSSRFMELQKLSGLPQFGNLSGRMAGSAEGPWDGQLSDTRDALMQGARLLQSFLFDEASQSSLRMNRESAPPPDQYRKMVEQYFRRLAREPEE